MSESARVLLLVPHPDDEAVGCAVAVRRARRAGANFFALYLTTGVPPREQLWPWQCRRYAARVAKRRAEAETAARLLGLTPVGFQDWPSRCLKSHLAAAFTLIEVTIAARGIDALWAPAWEGAHQDHDAANFLASRFVGRLPVTEFAEYNFASGAVRSQCFPSRRGGEAEIVLTPEEHAFKREALALYASERVNLRHVACAVETLRPLPAHDYAAAPHAGRLFHARFQWVPFRHPRVDFDPPEMLRAALERYAADVRLRPAIRVDTEEPKATAEAER